MMEEVEKYRRIYSGEPRWSRYGHSNHGRAAAPLVRGARSLVDVGCGWNEFAKACRGKGVRAVGVDFACPGADVIAAAQSLPFRDRQFEIVTAFDMLEHLREEDVPAVLREFARVAGRFVFSICYGPSRNLVDGETLHPCVMPEAWWRERIAEAGGSVKKWGKYLHGDFDAARPA